MPNPTTTLITPLTGQHAVVRPFALTLMKPQPPEAFAAPGESGRWDPQRQITLAADGTPPSTVNALTTYGTRRHETVDDNLLAGNWW